MDFSTIQNTPKKNQALVNSAFIMGLISIICAFTCFSFLSPVFGGLGIIFALLSKGKEDVMEKKAKRGLVLASISLIATVAFTAFTFIYTFIMVSQQTPDELHDNLNEAYEEVYGQSFDELYKEIYGEDFDDMYEEMYKNIYGDM